MPKKYRQKYRIPSARLQQWDYRNAGAYFITICTENREPFFGHIAHGRMHLSPTGAIADVLWHEIKNHHPTVQLDAFIVMPNHIHGILILGDGDIDETSVETLHATSLPPTQKPIPPSKSQSTDINNPDKNEFMAGISPKRGSISSIVRSYKSAVTKHARRLGYDFGWQSRFYDHIIRDKKSFENIRNYILRNPENWTGDKFHS